MRDNTPVQFRMPAEWVAHERTWLSWPHNPETWPEHLDTAEAVMAQAVRALLDGEHVDVNVLHADHADHVRTLVGDTSRYRFALQLHEIPTNDAWCRDHGAIFVYDASDDLDRHATVWRYNAWGGKYPPFDLDDAVAGKMAEIAGSPAVEIDMVLEGGSVEVDGRGRLMTTASCLLNKNRNPALSVTTIETNLRKYLGAEEILWLGGEIAGDDTDGHIDNLARFVGRNRIVTALEPDPTDPNHESLRENFERLQRHRFADGSQAEIIPLPMPNPVFAGTDRLPASYCNFYVANAVVLLPAYGCPQDREAAEILQECFPDRRVVALDCRDVVRGLGAFHCLTQQVPIHR